MTSYGDGADQVSDEAISGHVPCGLKASQQVGFSSFEEDDTAGLRIPMIIFSVWTHGRFWY